MTKRLAAQLKNKSDPFSFLFNKDDWPKLISFLIDAMVRFEKALKEPLNKINQKLKTRNA